MTFFVSSDITFFSLQGGYTFDFNQGAFWKCSNSKGGPGGFVAVKGFFVNLIHAGKIIHGGKKHRGLDRKSVV